MQRPARGASRRPRSPARPQQRRRRPAHLACPTTLQHRTAPTQPAPGSTGVRPAADHSAPNDPDSTPRSAPTRPRRAHSTAPQHAPRRRQAPLADLDPDRHLATPTDTCRGSSTHSHSAQSRHRHSADFSASTIPTCASSQHAGPVKPHHHHSGDSSTRLEPSLNTRSDPDHRSARTSADPSTHFDPERTLDLDGAAPKRFVPTVAHED